MIKGRYVATVLIDFNIDESEPGLYPLKKLKAIVTEGDLDKFLVAMISDEMPNGCSVGLNRQYADLYKDGDGNG